MSRQNRVEIDGYGQWVLVETDDAYDLAWRLRRVHERLGRVVDTIRGCVVLLCTKESSR